MANQMNVIAIETDSFTGFMEESMFNSMAEHITLETSRLSDKVVISQSDCDYVSWTRIDTGRAL